MSPIEREMHALRALASMPFLDALELASVSGAAARTMHDAVSGLRRSGLVDTVPHATDLIAPTRRFYMTDRGLDRLAWEPGVDVLVDWSLLTPREMSGMLGISKGRVSQLMAPLVGANLVVRYEIEWRERLALTG